MFHFPLIDPKGRCKKTGRRLGLDHYSEHVYLELEEFKEARFVKSTDEQAKDVVDILHAAETLVRKFFKEHPELSFGKVKSETTVKNHNRGYYT